MIQDDGSRSSRAGLARRADPAESAARPMRRGGALVGETWNRRRRLGAPSAAARLLSAADERALAARVQAGDQDAREELVVANLRLVHYVVRDYPDSSLPREDLIQEGSLGLIRAAEIFNPAVYPVRFATYATYWIRAHIQRAIGENCSLIKFPEYARLLRARYDRLVHDLAGVDDPAAADQDFAIKPEELAKRLGVPVRRLDRARLTLIERVSQGDLDESIADRDRSVEDDLIDEEARQALYAAIATLNPFEAWVVKSRHGLDDPQGDLPNPQNRGDAPLRAASKDNPRSYLRLSLDCGLPPHRVRTIEKAAMEKLRAILSPPLTTAPNPPREVRKLRADPPRRADIA